MSMSYNGRLLFLLSYNWVRKLNDLMCQCPTTDDYYFYATKDKNGVSLYVSVSMSYNGRLLFLRLHEYIRKEYEDMMCQCPTTDDYYFYQVYCMWHYFHCVCVNVLQRTTTISTIHLNLQSKKASIVSMSYNGRLLFLPCLLKTQYFQGVQDSILQVIIRIF